MKSLLLPALIVSQATAAVVDTSYDNPSANTSFGYEAFVTLSGNDSWTYQTTVGGWSHLDLQTSGDRNAGWGHASSWYLVELTVPTTFTVGMTTTTNGALPGLTIYTGESLNHDVSQRHTYSNNGNDLAALNSGWDLNATPLSVAGYAENLTGNSLSQSFSLDAGRYTIALGNAADSSDQGRLMSVDYDFSFTTVPEPSTAVLAGLASLVLLRRRR